MENPSRFIFKISDCRTYACNLFTCNITSDLRLPALFLWMMWRFAKRSIIETILLIFSAASALLVMARNSFKALRMVLA